MASRSDHQPDVVVGGQDAHDEEDETGGREDGSDGVEGARRIRRQGVFEVAAQHDDQCDHQGLEDEGGPPADPRGDQPADQRTGRGADPAQPDDDPNARAREDMSVKRSVVRMYTGGMSSGGADPLEDRVAEDQDPQARGDGAQQGADPVDDEAGEEAALAAPAVGQLAAGDHQRRHDEQEDRDGDLHALNRGVEVLADVVDHHVHVRAGEAADELCQGERGEDPPLRRRRLADRRRLSDHCAHRPIGAAGTSRARAVVNGLGPGREKSHDPARMEP